MHTLESCFKEEEDKSEIEFRIAHRKKYSRLTDSDRLFVVKEVKLNRRSIKELAKSMHTSSSTIRRTVSQMWSEGNSTRKWFDSKLLSKQITSRTERIIKSFISQRRQWYTAAHIKDYIKKEVGQDVSCSKIRKYLKETLKFSYRKGSSKPWFVEVNKLKLGRVWFSYKIFEIINYRTLLVNIDETSLSNSVFHNRSWFLKGESGEIFSTWYKGSISVMLAVTSDGDYFGSPIKESVNSFIYKQFLENLEGWLKKKKGSQFSNIILIHDNAPIHRAYEWQEFMKYSQYQHAFLPPYTPEYAPIELVFSSLKSHVKKKQTKTLIDFKKEIGLRVIANSLSKLSRNTIMRCWRHSLWRMKWDANRFIHN